MAIFDKKSILKRIKLKSEETGMAEATLSRMANDDKPDLIRNWRRDDKDVQPTIDKLVAVADALNVAPEWLIFGIERDVQRVPLVSWVSAGKLDGGQYDFSEDDFLSVPELGRGKWIALRVEGNSMDLVSPEKSVILVNRAERELINNAFYVISDQDGMSTYKQYKSNPARFCPVSTDRRHVDIFPDPSKAPAVIGRVRKTILDL